MASAYLRGSDGDFSADAANLDKETNKFSDEYVIVFGRAERANRNVEGARTAVGMPTKGQPHRWRPEAVCVAVRVRSDSRCGKRWIGTVSYEVPPPADTGAGGGGDPGDGPYPGIPLDLKITGGPTEVMRPFERDRKNKWVLNAAGDRFDPPRETPFALYQVNISRNEQAPFNYSIVEQYHNTINADAFKDWPAGKCLLKIGEFEGLEAQVGNQTIKYIRQSYHILYCKDGWKAQPQNAGYYEKFALPTDQHTQENDGKGRRRCKDHEGRDCVIPMMLDEQGKQLPLKDVLDKTNYLEFDEFETVSWSGLNLQA